MRHPNIVAQMITSNGIVRHIQSLQLFARPSATWWTDASNWYEDENNNVTPEHTSDTSVTPIVEYNRDQTDATQTYGTTAHYIDHMLRKQAAIHLVLSNVEPSSIFVTEQDIDNHFIWCDRNDDGIHEPRPQLEQISIRNRTSARTTLQDDSYRPRLGLLLPLPQRTQQERHTTAQVNIRLRQARCTIRPPHTQSCTSPRTNPQDAATSVDNVW
jgi:hypothetical protein